MPCMNLICAWFLSPLIIMALNYAEYLGDKIIFLIICLIFVFFTVFLGILRVLKNLED